MKCQNCQCDLGEDNIFCPVCGAEVYPYGYTNYEQIRERLAMVITMIIVMAFFVWLLASCNTKQPQELKKDYFKGMAVYRTAVQIYSSEVKEIDIHAIDSIYIHNLRNQR